MIEKGFLLAIYFPKELRILIALAAAALLGVMMVGFGTENAGATPVGGPYIQPCVNSYTGQISHANGKCPAGTYYLDLSTGDKTLCINNYTGRVSYRPATGCSGGEFAYYAESSYEIWGCVNPWTGSVAWMPTQASPCYGWAMPFDVGYITCFTTFAPVAADKVALAPTC
jgi:hypothetical protein